MTAMIEVQKMLDSYLAWLKDETVLREVNEDWVQVTTPHLDRHNDYLQFYVCGKDGRYTLTDDGYIINDLDSSGCSLESPKRQALLKLVLNGFGVKLKGTELRIEATAEDFPLKKHSLIQAMLAVNDLFYLASPHVASLFYEDVVRWLDEAGIRYTPRPKFAGKTGFDHLFHFVIPRSRQAPERIVQAITNPTKAAAKTLIFCWEDAREQRPTETRLHPILNDSGSTVHPSVISAMGNYGIDPILWSGREEAVKLLAA